MAKKFRIFFKKRGLAYCVFSTLCYNNKTVDEKKRNKHQLRHKTKKQKFFEIWIAEAI